MGSSGPGSTVADRLSLPKINTSLVFQILSAAPSLTECHRVKATIETIALAVRISQFHFPGAFLSIAHE